MSEPTAPISSLLLEKKTFDTPITARPSLLAKIGTCILPTSISTSLNVLRGFRSWIFRIFAFCLVLDFIVSCRVCSKLAAKARLETKLEIRLRERRVSFSFISFVK